MKVFTLRDHLAIALKDPEFRSVIARLESGTDERMPSIDLLSRIANASDARLDIRLTRRM